MRVCGAVQTHVVAYRLGIQRPSFYSVLINMNHHITTIPRSWLRESHSAHWDPGILAPVRRRGIYYVSEPPLVFCLLSLHLRDTEVVPGESFRHATPSSSPETPVCYVRFPQSISWLSLFSWVCKLARGGGVLFGVMRDWPQAAGNFLRISGLFGKPQSSAGLFPEFTRPTKGGRSPRHRGG